ncbi:hypothetical protein FHK92_26875 [Pseudomonas brassicacearum subsp. neoaurantiaca]|uniref:Uncharacterized protein n=1 Tax=Pseudomonas brassicacearum subsp. neoaurantiaca TaxID=494916 RepID=A0A7V8UGY0_9PSED|nr:hypothetical protein [Pseudomonas brassicacearum subsp. neoaurantiaca]
MARELAPAGVRSSPYDRARSENLGPAAQSSGSKLPRHKSGYVAIRIPSSPPGCRPVRQSSTVSRRWLFLP